MKQRHHQQRDHQVALQIMLSLSVKRRNEITNAAVFTQFIERCTTAISLDDLAKRNGVSRATMKRRFTWRWLIDVPDPTADHS